MSTKNAPKTNSVTILSIENKFREKLDADRREYVLQQVIFNIGVQRSARYMSTLFCEFIMKI